MVLRFSAVICAEAHANGPRYRGLIDMWCIVLSKRAALEAFDEAGAPYDELEKMKDTDPDRFDDYDRAMMFAQTQNVNPDTIRWGQKHDFPHVSARRRPPGGYDIPWSRKFEHGGYCNSLTGRIGSGLKAGSANDAP